MNIVKALVSLSNFMSIILYFTLFIIRGLKEYVTTVSLCVDICLCKIYQISSIRRVVIDSIILKTVFYEAIIFVSRSKLEFLKL